MSKESKIYNQFHDQADKRADDSLSKLGRAGQDVVIAPALAEDAERCDQRALQPDRIAFLNWNIYKGKATGWQDDLDRLAREHDLLAIQEARLNDVMHTLLDDAGHSWSMNTAFYLQGDAAGVMTASSAIINNSCGFLTAEPFIRIPKSALVSYYAIEGHDEHLLVANIHSINFSLGINSYCKQLDQLYQTISHHAGPMIVAGDFNSWSGRRMSVVEQLMQRLDLSDIVYKHPHRTRLFGKEIDHVFYRQLQVIDNNVLQVNSSDHNPISIHFRYQPKD